MASNKEYKKLGRAKLRRTTLFDRNFSSVWLGPDHLLLIDSMGGYVENYKRFYYSDIQGLFLRKSHRRTSVGLLIGIPLFFTVAGAFTLEPISFGIMSGILFILFVINLMKGPGVQTYIKTAVQVEQLPSLNRLPKAKKHLASIRQKIEEYQGLLGPEQAQQLLAAGGELTATRAMPFKSTPTEKLPDPPPASE